MAALEAKIEALDDTITLLKIPALGSSEIEWGKFHEAEQVFADLDKADLCQMNSKP